jgi:hypothetical protein
LGRRSAPGASSLVLATKLASLGVLISQKVVTGRLVDNEAMTVLMNPAGEARSLVERFVGWRRPKRLQPHEDVGVDQESEPPRSHGHTLVGAATGSNAVDLRLFGTISCQPT